jgi:hypothetical protein
MMQPLTRAVAPLLLAALVACRTGPDNNVAGIIAGDAISGRFWFNANATSTPDILFMRRLR